MQNKNFLDKVKLRLESLNISLSDISHLIDVPMIDINNFFDGKVEKNISDKITNLLGLDDFENELIDIQTLELKEKMGA
jgi:predicted XRE-type DNA-binding protein